MPRSAKVKSAMREISRMESGNYRRPGRLKVKLGAPGSKESRIVGKKMALEKRHVSSFIAAEHNKTMRLVTGVRRTKEGGPPQWPIVGNCRRQPRGLSGYEVYPKCNIECVRVQHHKYKTNI